MRHIVISIILVFIFLTIFGQTQQTLKNGFVAATDSGVWYLQDGFSEWVKLNVNEADESTFQDTCLFVEYWEKLSSLFYEIRPNNIQSLDRYNIYRNYISEHSPRIGGGYPQAINISYTSKFTGNIHDVVYSFSSFGHRADVRYGTTVSSWITEKEIDNIASDRDTILISTGADNALYKVLLSKTTGFISNIFISGLHSRPTDSHQICYNSDDDEFIIVSDSGIVYSYDKTTLTTIDTLSNCDKIYDIAYGGGYVYILTGQSNSTSTKTFISSDLLSFNEAVTISDPTNVTLAISYSPRLDKILILYGYDGTGSAQLVDNAGNVQNTISLSGLNIFDLDYINYLSD